MSDSGGWSEGELAAIEDLIRQARDHRVQRDDPEREQWRRAREREAEVWHRAAFVDIYDLHRPMARIIGAFAELQFSTVKATTAFEGLDTMLDSMTDERGYIPGVPACGPVPTVNLTDLDG